MPGKLPASPVPGAVGQRLRQIVGWAIAGTLGASISCGVEMNRIELPRHPHDAAGRAAIPPPVRCGAPLLRDYPLQLARPVDYLAIYTGPRILVSSLGNACSTAPDAASCDLLLSAASDISQACWNSASSCAPYAVSTLGAEVSRYDDVASLLAVLGPIDTEAEASVVAGFVRRSFGCWDARVTGTETGYRVETDHEGNCGRVVREAVEVQRDGSTSAVMVLSAPQTTNCPAPQPGRRTAGLVLGELRIPAGPLAKLFSHAAQLEAASVPAFERLSRELQRLGAPAAMLAAARSCARDEIRHARLMAALAAREGAHVPRPEVRPPQSARSAFEIALENAREGCVRESFAALLALHQAQAARDPLVQRVMRTIAADEARHAELAFHVAHFLEAQLSAHERLAITRAQADSVRDLAREIDSDWLSSDIARELGWPSRTTQQAMLNGLASALHLS